jgi:hypothetical protein
MRDNLMIHRFRENSNENLMVDIPKAIKKEYGIDLKFVRIHSKGPPRRGSDQPRPIVGKLENSEKKEKNPTDSKRISSDIKTDAILCICTITGGTSRRKETSI